MYRKKEFLRKKKKRVFPLSFYTAATIKFAAQHGVTLKHVTSAVIKVFSESPPTKVRQDSIDAFLILIYQ